MKLFFNKISITSIVLCSVLLFYPFHTEVSTLPRGEVPELFDYLAAIKNVASQNNYPQENITRLCTSLEKNDLSAITPTVVETALQDAIDCLSDTKKLSEQELQQLLKIFDEYHKNV